ALMTAFQAQDFAAAETALKACRELPDPFKVSPLYDLYAGRLTSFSEAPPSPDWDGVMDMAKH
ncbi:MAG: hypothetical protein ACR2PG_12450, partial [Hyphomicrobiaceae bacterium]